MPFPSSVRLEECTWPEVETALENGRRTAIVAVGSIEQHGPHLPLNTDTLDGDELSRRIAVELGDALAAPTIRPDCSGHHTEFPGTITVPPETLMDLIRARGRSRDRRERDRARGPRRPHGPAERGSRDAGVDYLEDAIHAGAAETAMVLAIDEGLVRTDRLEAGPEGSISTARLLSEGFKSITENGVLGDPDEATPEAGNAIFDAVTAAHVERIEAERDAVR